MSERIAPINNDRGVATRRIMRLFASATSDELAYGLRWYAEASGELASFAASYGRTLDEVAAVAAALSPQTSWPDNLNKTRMLLETGDTYGLGDGRRKAKRILAGESPLDVLGGPKVRAFYDNLRDPLNSDAVTLDRHAFDAVAGMVTNDRVRKTLERKGEYERIADIYRSAADALGVRPHVVQAVIWAVWRNRFGRFHYQRTRSTP